MAFNPGLSLKTLLILVIFASCIQGKEVDSFNLLLPTSYHSSKGRARQIVTTSGECYQWESTDTSIVKVQGTHHGLVPSETASKNPNCNSNGIVELSYEGAYPSSVYVTARDKTTNEVISIPVRIRDLKRVSIFTKSRIMNIREIQNLQVYGFDSENNTFTSLEGLRFRWTITEISDPSYSTGAIEKIALRNSSLYMALDTRKKLQSEENVESDLLVIKALHVGKVTVRARCLQPKYQTVFDQITLYIQQKFQIYPGLPVHLLAGSTFHYSLMTPSGIAKALPESYYNISLTNPLFRISNTLTAVAPLSSSLTELSVSDTRTLPPFSQTVQIYSHQPDSIQILVPETIIIGQEVNYKINFYSQKRLLQGTLDPTLLNIEISQKNTNKVFGLDRKSQKLVSYHKGAGTFKVQYNGLTAQKQIISITPLKMLSVSSSLTLPVNQIYHLSIIGGSGSYKFKNSGQDILSISSHGLLTTRRQGETTITVTDQKYQNNFIQIQVNVLRMGNIYSIEEYKEFNVDEEGSLYIAASPRISTQAQAQAQRSKGGVIANNYYTECNDALLRGLVISPSPSSTNKILQVLNVNPINTQTLTQILSTPSNTYLNRSLEARASVFLKNIIKNYQIYVQNKQISQSQLQRLFLQMQSYGLCAKVTLRAIQKYDGIVQITKKDETYVKETGKIKLRVYEQMSNIVTINQKNDQILLTPLSSFKWQVAGGPYKWDAPAMGDLQIYLNGTKLNKQQKYPIITCPDHQVYLTYTLRYSNLVSPQLLRPVSQQKQIKVKCSFPNRLKIGLPYHQNNKNSQNLDIEGFVNFLNSQQNSQTIYIHPGQCFRVSIEPVFVLDSKLGKYVRFYNSSNVKIQYKGHQNGKLEEVTNLKNKWNNHTVKYDSSNRRKSQLQKQDYIQIVASHISSLKKQINLPSQLNQHILIKTLSPLQFSVSQISLPSYPGSKYTLSFAKQADPSRFSIKCNENALKCVKLANGNIEIYPRSIQKSAVTKLSVRDSWVLGNPQIQLLVKVHVIAGIDLKIARAANLNKQKDKIKVNKQQLSSTAWIFQGEQFLLFVDVYSYNVSLIAEGKIPRQPIKDMDPSAIQLNAIKIKGYSLQQLQRSYDPISKLTIIHCIVQSTSLSPSSSSVQISLSASINPSTPSNALLHSNTARLTLYPPITLIGISSLLPSSASQQNTKYNEVQAYVNIMESCSAQIQVQGGPPSIKTKIVGNPGEGTYLHLSKNGQRNYLIQTVKSTEKIDQDQINGNKINKNAKNLITLLVYIEQDQHKLEVTQIKCLVIVSPIKQFIITGNNHLLSHKQIRHIVQFSQPQSHSHTNVYKNIIKQQCSLKYKWSTSSSILKISSDPQKMGINITPDNYATKGNSQVQVIVYNKHNRQVGRSSKNVQILSEQNIDIFQDETKNTKITVNSDNLLLIPPNSGVTFKNGAVQQYSSCDRQQNSISITNAKKLTTSAPTQNPQLIKYFHTETTNSLLPVYLSIQVTQICSVMIQNSDGAVNISPEQKQSLKFYIIDCIGRRFQHQTHRFSNIQYKTHTSNPSVATSSVSAQGLLVLQGHHVGTTHLHLQIYSNSQLKAKDIIPLNVNIFIQPAHPVSIHVGDIVTFRAPNQIINGGEWASADHSILRVNGKTGETVGYGEGESYVKLGGMSARVSVVKIVDVIKVQGTQGNGYEYEIKYSGKIYPRDRDTEKYVKNQIQWHCDVLGKDGDFLRGVVTVNNQNNRVTCHIQKIAGLSTPQSPVKSLKLRIRAQNRNSGFSFSRQFTEQIQMFIILSERHINPRDPKYKKQNHHHIVIIQTNQRLQMYQTGGKQQWILSNQFNGARQVINLDLSHYRTGEWKVHFTNSRTKQHDFVVISQVIPSTNVDVNRQVPEGGWKWTDVLVVIMVVNILALLGYQIYQSKKDGGHAKVY